MISSICQSKFSLEVGLLKHGQIHLSICISMKFSDSKTYNSFYDHANKTSAKLVWKKKLVNMYVDYM